MISTVDFFAKINIHKSTSVKFSQESIILSIFSHVFRLEEKNLSVSSFLQHRNIPHILSIFEVFKNLDFI